MKTNSLTLIVFLFLLSAGAGFAATTHVFKSGDTLWDLAARHYGDPTLYPVLLEVNGIDNPRAIPNGKVIIIPDKSDMKKIAAESDPARKRSLIDAARGGTPSEPEPTAPVTETGQDATSRTGNIDPDQTGFNKVLGGPKVSPAELIKTNVP